MHKLERHEASTTLWHGIRSTAALTAPTLRIKGHSCLWSRIMEMLVLVLLAAKALKMSAKSIRWLFLTFLLITLPAHAQADSRLLRQFGKGTARAVAWSPDGKTIAIGGSLGIWLYPPDLSQPTGHLEGNSAEIIV